MDIASYAGGDRSWSTIQVVHHVYYYFMVVYRELTPGIYQEIRKE